MRKGACLLLLRAAVVLLVFTALPHAHAWIKVSVALGSARATGEGIEPEFGYYATGHDVAIKVEALLAPSADAPDSHPEAIVSLDDAVLYHEFVSEGQSPGVWALPQQQLHATELAYGLHHVLARAVRGGVEIESFELPFTIYREDVVPAPSCERAGDYSSDAACRSSHSPASLLVPPHDSQPRLWLVMSASNNHAHLLSHRRAMKFHYPDSSTPVLGKLAAAATLNGHGARSTCSASLHLRFSYVHELGPHTAAQPPSLCSEYLLTTELLPPLQLEGVRVASQGLRDTICFSTRYSDSVQITSLDLGANLSTSIVIEASCPPHCTAAAVNVHLQSTISLNSDSIFPALSHPYTISLLCPSVENQQSNPSSLTCQCEATSCSEWSHPMVAAVFLAPSTSAAHIASSASGARLASSYEVYWALTNNIAGGIAWHSDAAAPAGHASLFKLGDSVFSGCGACHDGQFVRFGYPLEFMRDLPGAYEVVPPQSAPASCAQYVFMTIPHKPTAALVHNMMPEDHGAFANGSAWRVRSCAGVCNCDGAAESSSANKPIQWKYDADSDAIEFLETNDSAHPALSGIKSSIYDLVSERQPLSSLSTAHAAAPDDNAIIEAFLDNSHLPYHPTPTVAALVFGQLRDISHDVFDKFNAAVMSSVGPRAIDLFLVLRPFHTPRCFDGLCSPCSIARAFLLSVRECLEYDVPRQPSDAPAHASDPAGIARLTGAAFSRKWQSEGRYERFESSSFGSPPGFYLWQPLQLAFSLALAQERAMLTRYSYMIRLRLDKTFSAFKPAASWNEHLSTSRAYVRGFLNDGGRLSENGDQTIILGRERVGMYVPLQTPSPPPSVSSCVQFNSFSLQFCAAAVPRVSHGSRRHPPWRSRRLRVRPR
jgi:hypothetical protein